MLEGVAEEAVEEVVEPVDASEDSGVGQGVAVDGKEVHGELVVDESRVGSEVLFSWN